MAQNNAPTSSGPSASSASCRTIDAAQGMSGGAEGAVCGPRMERCQPGAGVSRGQRKARGGEGGGVVS